MSKLIYASYPLLDQDGIPDWVGKLAGNPVARREKWVVYNPALGLTGNLEGNLVMAAVLSDDTRLSLLAARNRQQLKLDPMLFESFGKIVQRLRAADEAPTLDVSFRNLYVILRSDIVLVDLDRLGHGEPSQEVLYAYLSGVPVVGIAHRFMLSPWMADKLSAVIFPRTSDEIARQVLAHDHKTSAMFDYYRALESDQPNKKTDSTVADLQEMQKKLDSLRDVAAEQAKKRDAKGKVATGGSPVAEPSSEKNDGDKPSDNSV